MEKMPENFSISTTEYGDVVRWTDVERELSLGFKKTGDEKQDEKLLHQLTRAAWQSSWLYDNKQPPFDGKK